MDMNMHKRRTTMEVTTRKTEDALIVKVAGAVDTEAAEELRTELGKALKLKPSNVIMDLSLVPTMGSSGIGKILFFSRAWTAIMRVLRSRGFTKISITSSRR